MQPTWLKQTDKPLYPELEWSRPENKAYAGKLLIVGGTLHGFAAPAEAYGVAIKAGAGSVRVLLPESLRKSVSKLFPGAEFAPSTPSGSFASQALGEICAAATWADSVLLPGDLSRNSETTVLLESFFEKYQGQVTLTKDVADIFCQQPHSILHRPETTLVIAMGQLRKLGNEARFPRAFTGDMGVVQLAAALHEFSKRFAPSIITKHQDQLFVAHAGQVSATTCRTEQQVWRLRAASEASVWRMQNPSKPFGALTTAMYSVRQ